MWDAGAVYELRTSEQPISESASSSWPTASASLVNDGESEESWEARRQRNLAKGINGNGQGTPLTMAAQTWPTARQEDGESCGNHPDAMDSLTGATRNWELWRTPDGVGTGGPRNRQDSIGDGHQVTIAEQAEHWQTPASDSFRSRSGDRKDEMGLDQQARFFPTPAARDYRTPNRKSYQDRSGTLKGEQLQNFVEHSWPTPNTKDANSAARHTTTTGVMHPGTTLTDASRQFHSLPAPAIPDGQRSSGSGPISRRRLNPRFVEWLMGFPPGWSEP